MTDWERVERLRSRGRSWTEIAEDERVKFAAPPGSDPGHALQVVYLKRGYAHAEKARRGRSSSNGGTKGGAEGWSGRSRRRRLVAWGVGIGLVAVVASVLVFAATTPISGTNEIVTYCGGEGQAQHYHVLLVINANGAQQHLPYDPSQPAAIGYINDPAYTNPNLYCSPGGIHALHTHDGSGIIHAELPSVITTVPTLGDFFTIWGQPLSSTQVWSFSGHVTAQVKDMNTGTTTDYSQNPGGIALYTPPGGPFSNPFPIPQNLIFNGAYGSGESGGTFDGEIIWLNVTTAPSAAVTFAECLCAAGQPCPSGNSTRACPTAEGGANPEHTLHREPRAPSLSRDSPLRAASAPGTVIHLRPGFSVRRQGRTATFQPPAGVSSIGGVIMEALPTGG
ncbi:hypothetical protein B2A_00231 [mine drainage metagenome]|uniref:Uncharacterized protein n=1 Tax=mine drainage metagenome TaxID=410659 RepID=T1BKD6_9ZZZZ